MARVTDVKNRLISALVRGDAKVFSIEGNDKGGRVIVTVPNDIRQPMPRLDLLAEQKALQDRLVEIDVLLGAFVGASKGGVG